MNGETLTKAEWDLILQSLEYTKQRFADYNGYPSAEYKRQQIAEVEATTAKVRAAKRGAA
jgi:hypothetical protein